jgi:hypothetical protein
MCQILLAGKYLCLIRITQLIMVKFKILKIRRQTKNMKTIKTINVLIFDVHVIFNFALFKNKLKSIKSQ